MGDYKSMVKAPTGWLGSIPEHWECKKIGSLFSERKTKVSDADYPPLSVTKLGIVPQLSWAMRVYRNSFIVYYRVIYRRRRHPI